jgi:hypothetical protein
VTLRLVLATLRRAAERSFVARITELATENPNRFQFMIDTEDRGKKFIVTVEEVQ